jgi:hypothetical protein
MRYGHRLQPATRPVPRPGRWLSRLLWRLELWPRHYPDAWRTAIHDARLRLTSRRHG